MKKFWIVFLTVVIVMIGFVAGTLWFVKDVPYAVRVGGFIIFQALLVLPASGWWEAYFKRILNKD